MTSEQMSFMYDVVTRARETIEWQQGEIATLRSRVDQLQGALSVMGHYALAVDAHNESCEKDCNSGGSCGYEGVLRRTGRRCAGCPAVFKVDVMPTKGSA